MRFFKPSGELPTACQPWADSFWRISGERTISLRSDDDTVLQTDMTFHVICGMWMDSFGYEVSESIRVTDDGVECFTSVPRGLIRT